ncbi:MAG: Spx/MgsR family RNA polymerase-binding regulatory protein [Parvibaculum sp.]|nr:Spx/MgsR family RNA polymerase-binding regulatory protein [Parvibaculum sp.]
MITVYGLKNCDTCRKALTWLKAEKIAHRFVDFKTEGVSKADVTRFVKAVGADKLLNKASTTWRSLGDEVKGDLTEAPLSEAGAIALMVEHPALIKRPVFVSDATIISGFKEPQMKALKAGLK